MEEKNQKSSYDKWADSAVVILLFLSILFLLHFTGTLNSGYHLIDDHEMLRINSDLQKSSFLQTSINWIGNDLNIRLRPIYFLHRVLEIKLFGINFFSLSFYTGFLAGVAFSLFYLGARRLNYSITESLLLIILTFVGFQMAVWWRLGPCETIGMVFFGLSFYFMAGCINSRRYLLNNITFIIFLIMTSLCKSSFIIIVPAFVIYKIWNESKFFHTSIKESVQNNYLSALPLVAMLVEILTIFLLIGTNGVGYAGPTFDLGVLSRGVTEIFSNINMLADWFKFLGIIIFCCLVSFFFLGKNRLDVFEKSVKNFLIPLSFSAFIILPNILLYAKSGMYERYLLPTTFGLAFLIINLIKYTRSKILLKAEILACAVFIYISYGYTYNNAVAFADDGIKTNQFFSTVEKNAHSDSKILVVADPVYDNEVSWSIKTYLSLAGFNDLYFYPMAREYSSDSELTLRSVWEKWFEGRVIKKIEEEPNMVIVVNKSQSDLFFNSNGISKSDYENVIKDDNPRAVYMKNN